MQIGFEEDSPFYTPPTEKKPEVVTVKKEEATAIEEESETMFSYSREDGE
jgi:hypothetical protein